MTKQDRRTTTWPDVAALTVLAACIVAIVVVIWG